MKNYVPTIGELLAKPPRELSAIFQKAAQVADDATREPAERAAARTIVNNVRCCQPRPPTP